MKDDIEALHERLVDRHGTSQVIADGIGMSLSAFLRGVREGTLNIENCLKLAEWAGEDPLYVLRAAHKGDVATQLERLFGKATTPLSALDRELLALPQGAKEKFIMLARALAPSTEEGRRRA